MEELGILDQLPFMSFYSQMIACFPLSEDTELSDVVTDLERGLEYLIRTFPFVDKKVILVQDIESEVATSGTFKLTPREKDDEPILRIKDFHGSSYEEISKLKAPASLLDAKDFAPMKSMPEVCDFSSPEPVLAIQANFITGGLLLCFAGMHNVFDGNGMGHLIRHYATACRGDKISEDDIKAGNLTRPGLIPTLGPNEPSLDYSIIHRKLEHKAHSPSDVAPAPWKYFRFSAPKLAELKAEASKESFITPKSSWISTNDAVTALVWRAIVTARLPNLEPEMTSTLVRAVNGRKFFRPPIPDCYLGVCLVGSFLVLPLSDLTQKSSIADISAILRKDLNEIDDYHVRNFASFVKSEPDKRNITFSPPSPSTDVLLSSWASLPIYTSDFGPHLGKPEFVRRPHFGGSDGFVYFMPKNLAGELDVAIGLKEDDMQRLKKDPVWTAHADLIG